MINPPISVGDRPRGWHPEADLTTEILWRSIMADTKIHPISSAATDSFESRMKAHKLNGVRLCSADHSDTVYSITSHIQAVALVMEAAHENTRTGECSADGLNPEILAGAFGAIAFMASLANFLNSEASRN